MIKEGDLKWKTFEKEIEQISNPGVKDWVKNTLNNTPDYFFSAAASSTGKYHPACTIKEGGLIVHVKRAFYIAERLCRGWDIIGTERDIVLAAIILHDIAKTGRGQGSYEDYENHPLNAEKYFAENNVPGLVSTINGCIRHHMGLWTPESIKKPLADYTLVELAVYTSDYMSATKDLITPEDELSERK